MNNQNFFNNQVFIVTGASSGIGKAVALEAAKQGAKVVLAARNLEQLYIVAEEIIKIKSEFLIVQTDVSKIEDCKNLIQKTIEKFNKIDVLVNNAGISMRALFSEMKIEVFEKVMDINFFGTVYCSHFALPYLLKDKGTVVGVSSISGLTPLPARTAYSSSKYAMYGFLTTLRIENIKKGLNVLITHPGFTESNIRIHALTADGTEQGETPRHEDKMMTSEQVAIKILKGIRKKQKVQIMTAVGKITVFLNKLFPWWTHKLIYKTISKEPNTPLQKW